MSALSLALLGGFKLQTETGDAVPARQKRVQALLGYLAMHPGQAQRRDKLATLLWSRSDDEHARQSLRQTIRELRKSPQLANHAGLIVTPEAITMADDAFTIDVADFKRLAKAEAVDSLEQALELYQGEFLEGLALNEPVFEEWLSEIRRELSDTALHVMLKLLDAYERDGAAEAGLRIARRILVLDRFQETAHRAVMRCLDRLDRRTEAIQHYKACSETLKTELGVDPADATVTLYREIMKSSGEGWPDDSEADARTPYLDKILPLTARAKLARFSSFSAIAVLFLAIAIVGQIADFEPQSSNPVGWTGDVGPSELSLPTGPTIAVLPFDNLSDDPEQDYFADGITEDIITALSRFQTLHVFGSPTTFSYRDQNLDARSIGTAIGARFVLQGSVRQSKELVRIGVQLIDTSSGAQLWGRQYDRDLTTEDIFANWVSTSLSYPLHLVSEAAMTAD